MTLTINGDMSKKEANLYVQQLKEKILINISRQLILLLTVNMLMLTTHMTKFLLKESEESQVT